MDTILLICDVSEIDNINEGDEVLLFIGCKNCCIGKDIKETSKHCAQCFSVKSNNSQSLTLYRKKFKWAKIGNRYVVEDKEKNQAIFSEIKI